MSPKEKTGSARPRRPTIRRCMVPDPETIDAGKTLAAAHRMMQASHIRHLPVMAKGKLVGVVSQRDLHLVETLKDVDPAKVAVSEAMTPNPYTVSPRAPLHEVARVMADHKLGSAIVVEKGNVVGMFTTVDALRMLAALLQKR